MTTRQWQTIAAFSIVAAFMVLIVSVRVKDRAEKDAARAVVQLDSVTASLHDAQALARAGLTQSLAYRQRLDSLWGVIRSVQYAVPTRQRTPFTVVDTADVHAVTIALVTVTAERDTALSDLAATRADLNRVKATADDLAVEAATQARADSDRYATISAQLAAATEHAEAARTAIRPQWWKSLGRGIVATTKTVGLLAIGVAIGRHT